MDTLKALFKTRLAMYQIPCTETHNQGTDANERELLKFLAVGLGLILTDLKEADLDTQQFLHKTNIDIDKLKIALLRRNVENTTNNFFFLIFLMGVAVFEKIDSNLNDSNVRWQHLRLDHTIFFRTATKSDNSKHMATRILSEINDRLSVDHPILEVLKLFARV